MSLVDSLLLDPVRVNYFVAVRTDNAKGTGSLHDPLNGATKYETAFPCTISFSGREATVSTGGTVHQYANGDSIKISGVTGSGKRFFNGTFVIYEVAPTSFKYWMRGLPEEAAGGTITCARVVYLFDAVMAAMPANSAIHLGPGVFETMGFAPNITGGWTPKTGQKILGSGIDVMVLRLVKATSTANPTRAIGVPYSDFLIHFEAREMTIDCNLGGQPIPKPLDFAPVTCNAINVYGRHIRLSRIRAINFGNQAGIECFALFSGGAHPAYEDNNQEVYDCVIEDCIAEQPSENNVSETSIMGFLSNEDGGGRVAMSRAVVIRNNFVNGEYANGVRAEVETLTFVGDLGTLTTKTPHRHVDYKNVHIQGVTNIPDLNGVFPIEEIVSDTVLTFRAWFTPSLTPQGAMFIGGGVPNQAVAIDQIKPVQGDNRRFRIITRTPHYRTTKNNIVVQNVPIAGFNGSFGVAKINSPTELEYILAEAHDYRVQCHEADHRTRTRKGT
jgi:hypothetical protein